MSAGGDRELGGKITASSATLWFALSLLEEYGRRIETALNVTEAHADPAVEIGLYDAFGHVAWHTRGDMHAMNVCFTKALAGAVRESDAESQYRALYGLIVYYATNGDYAEAVSTARQLGELAAAIGDPKKLVTHRRLSAVAATFAGEHDSVRSHAECSASGATRPSGLFFDQRISARTMLARTLWQQGFADQARDCAQDGLELAQTTGHAEPLLYQRNEAPRKSSPSTLRGSMRLPMPAIWLGTWLGSNDGPGWPARPPRTLHRTKALLTAQSSSRPRLIKPGMTSRSLT
jgi:tetratricopeptide (TPR) repeat protein